jgi:hypothetical protein
MTQASELQRRHRYEPTPDDNKRMTPKKWEALLAVEELRTCTAEQVADWTSLSERAAGNHLRDLFDGGLITRTPVSRLSLADPHEPVHHSLLTGSAPNIHAMTKTGLKALAHAGFISDERAAIPPPKYTLAASRLIAHELLTADILVWLKRIHGGAFTRFKRAGAAYIQLPGGGILKPDARADMEFDGRPLNGFIEADRGTEQGIQAWAAKYHDYRECIGNGLLLDETGSKRLRVVVGVTNPKRQAKLKAVLEDLQSRFELIPRRFYIGVLEEMRGASESDPIWAVPGEESRQPFL